MDLTGLKKQKSKPNLNIILCPDWSILGKGADEEVSVDEIDGGIG